MLAAVAAAGWPSQPSVGVDCRGRRSARGRRGRRGGGRSTRQGPSDSEASQTAAVGAWPDYRPGSAHAPPDRTRPSRGDARHYTRQPMRTRRKRTDPGGPANVAKVTMPQLGESVAEGTIGKWLKQPGDHVDKYEPLVEVVTDKVNAEVPSPFEGILREILVEEGATVPNNAEIAVIETADDGAGASASSSAGSRGRDRITEAECDRVAADRPRHRSDPHGRRRAGRQRRTWSRRDGRRSIGGAGRHRVRRSIRGAGGQCVRRGRATCVGRPRCPHDPGRPSAPARARPFRGADHGHRRRWPHHPRGRAQGRRGDPYRHHARGDANGSRQWRRTRSDRSTGRPRTTSVPSTARQWARVAGYPRRRRSSSPAASTRSSSPRPRCARASPHR